MKPAPGVLTAALAALLLATVPVAAQPRSCSAPPAPGGTTRSVPAGHSKASSFAPHHTKRRSYGAPIPKPIVTRAGRGKRKTTAPAAASR
jgi:hypothetical protein